MGGGGGGMSDLGLDAGEDEDVFGGDGGDDDIGGGDDEAPPEEENASEEAPEDEEPDLELITSGDDAGDGDAFSIPKLDGSAVKVSQNIRKYKYDRSRIRHHGSSKTGNPDFNGMLNGKRSEDTMNDPYDNSYLRSMTTNPLGESNEYQPDDVKAFIPNDIMSALRKLDERVSSAEVEKVRANALLTEGNDDLFDIVDIDIDREEDR